MTALLRVKIGVKYKIRTILIFGEQVFSFLVIEIIILLYVFQKPGKILLLKYFELALVIFRHASFVVLSQSI